MPRDTSGRYILPAENPVDPTSVVSSEWANNTMEDLGTEVQDSLSRTGKGGMEAAVKILSGSKGAPGLGFDAESSSGLQRNDFGDVRIVSEGTPVFRTNPVTKGPEGWDNVNKVWVSLLPQALPEFWPTSAANVTYDNATSGLTAAQLQAAIDEVVNDAATAPPPNAIEVPYDNTLSQIIATEVQAAIDEIKAGIDALPPEYVNPATILTGKIAGADGTKIKGTTGYTPGRTSPGAFTITFDSAIAGAYVVKASPAFDGWGTSVNIHSETELGFQCRVADQETGVAQDRDWSFHLFEVPGQIINNFNNTILALSPAIYWPLQETSGTVAFDSTSDPATHNGTYRGTYSQGTAGLVPSDGTLVSVTFPRRTYPSEANVSVTTNRFNNTQAMSFLVCVRANGTVRGGELFRRDGNDSEKRHFYARVGSTGNISFAYADAQFPWDWRAITALGTNVLNGQPHLLVFTVDPATNTQEIWLDNVLVASEAGAVNNANQPTSTGMGVGQGLFTGSESWEGAISHWAYWQSVLTPAEIGQLYNSWTG